MKLTWITTVAIAALAAACAQPAEEAAPEPEAAETAAADAEPAAEPAPEPAPEPDAEPAAEPATALADVLAHPRRDNDRARDEWRNPEATLAFFDVQPEHTVVEALPGGGWYTRVVLPYVADSGAYMAINYPMDVFEQLFGDRLLDDSFRQRLEGWDESFPEQAAEWGGAVSGAFRFGAVPAEAQGQADRVLYIRALHNMSRFGRLDQTASDAYALLRPGGVVGVVQHRAPADETDERANGSRAYLREADVIAVFEAAGFVLEDTSEINANPRDPADHEIGVWALPPTYALGNEERDRYQAIGESDRMTLRFRKPA